MGWGRRPARACGKLSCRSMSCGFDSEQRIRTMNFPSNPLVSCLKNLFHSLRTEGRGKTIKRGRAVASPVPGAPLGDLCGPQGRLVTLCYLFGNLSATFIDSFRVEQRSTQ